jgi:hypothetical protein
MTTALLHVHTDFSYDGEDSPERLAAWAASRGLDLVCLTEHTNDFDDAKMERLVERCARASRPGCRLVAGLEFPVRGGFHLLAFGLARFRRLAAGRDVAEFARDEGAVVVLAHPARYRGSWPDDELLARLDGIEVWNARYDGRFIPPGALLDAVRRVRARHPRLALFGGQDLHALTANRLVTTRWTATFEPVELRARLTDGSARFGAGATTLFSAVEPGTATRALYRLLHAGYSALRRTRDRLVPAERA